MDMSSASVSIMSISTPSAAHPSSAHHSIARRSRETPWRNPSILALAPPHRFIHHRLEILLNPSALRGRHYHEDSEHVVDGIDKIEAAAGAVPAVLAERPVGARRRRGAYGKAETETAGGVWKIEGIMKDPGL